MNAIRTYFDNAEISACSMDGKESSESTSVNEETAIHTVETPLSNQRSLQDAEVKNYNEADDPVTSSKANQEILELATYKSEKEETMSFFAMRKYYKTKEEMDRQFDTIERDLYELDVYRGILVLTQKVKERYDGKFKRMKKRYESKIRKIQREKGIEKVFHQNAPIDDLNKIKNVNNLLEKKYQMLMLKYEASLSDNKELREENVALRRRFKFAMQRTKNVNEVYDCEYDDQGSDYEVLSFHHK